MEWVNGLEGAAGDQLTTGTVGSDEMGGGAGANATYVEGTSADDELQSTTGVFGRFTATRRARNDGTGDLIWTMHRFRAAADPASAVDMYRLTAGGVNNGKAGWRVHTDGRLRLLGGVGPDANPVASQKQYCDERIWVPLHVYDVDGVLMADDPALAGDPMQHLFIFDRLGKLEEHLMATIADTTTLDSSYWGIVTDSITWTVDFGPAEASDTRLYWRKAVDWIRTGGGTANRLELTAQIQGATHARLITSGPTELTSSEVELGLEGWVKFAVGSLPEAGASYYQQLEAKSPDGTWAGIGLPITQVTARGRTSDWHTTVIIICHRKDDGSAVWGDIPTRVLSIQNGVIDGDRSYDNPLLNAGDWQARWTVIFASQAQGATVKPMAEFELGYDVIFLPDDHDLGLTNAEWGGPGAGEDKLLIAWPAITAVHPLGPAPAGMPATGTHYSSIDRDGFCHLYPTFNSIHRSDPDDAEPAWTLGDPAPSKSAFGAAQDAWLEDQLTRADYDMPDGTGIVGYVLHLTKNLLGDASDPGWGGKTDAHAFYSAHREWFLSLCAERRGIIVDGDGHGFGKVDEVPGCDWPLIHPGGAFRDSGNMTWDPEFDESYPDPIDTADVELQGFGIIQTRRVGSNVTVRGIVRDSLAGIDRFTVEKTWTDAPNVGLPGAGMAGFAYTIDGVSTSGPNGMYGLRAGTARRPIAGKEAGLTPSAFGGNNVGLVRRGAHRLVLPIVIRDLDEDGTGAGNRALDATENVFRGLLNYEGPVTLGYCPVFDQPPTMETDAYQIASVEPVGRGIVVSDLAIILDIHADSWRGTVERTWITSTEHNLGSSTEGIPIPIFDGSTAKIPDSWHRFRGPLSAAMITDWRTKVRMRVTKPGGGTSIDAGEYLLVAPHRRKAWVLTSDSWDPDQGTQVKGWLTRTGPGVLMLPLTPMPADTQGRVRRVYIRGQFTGTTSESQWAVRGRCRY